MDVEGDPWGCPTAQPWAWGRETDLTRPSCQSAGETQVAFSRKYFVVRVESLVLKCPEKTWNGQEWLAV